LSYSLSVTPTSNSNSDDDNVVDASLVRSTCTDDTCHLSVDPSLVSPGDAYEVKVNACTSDETNCETLAFKIDFIDEALESLNDYDVAAADPVNWSVTISEIPTITHDLFPNVDTITSYTLTEDPDIDPSCGALKFTFAEDDETTGVLTADALEITVSKDIISAGLIGTH
jgi:hypothetical protein